MSIKQKWENQLDTNRHWAVYCGDALKVLKLMPDCSVNCVITSPPYFWLRDYQVESQLGQEDTVQEYVNNIASVMDEIYRLLTPNGLLFLNLGDTYYSGRGRSHGKDPKNSKRKFGLRAVDKSGGMGMGLQKKTLLGIPWRVALELTTRRWALRSAIIWQKKHLNESVKDRPRRRYEHIFMFSKSQHYYFNRKPLEKLDEEDVWVIDDRPESTNGIQTAPFPNEVARRCMEIGCIPGGTVLDPFAGSGTTLKVALCTGRSAIGIELNDDSCKYIVKHIQHMCAGRRG
jgi:DNA modification methylase